MTTAKTRGGAVPTTPSLTTATEFTLHSVMNWHDQVLKARQNLQFYEDGLGMETRKLLTQLGSVRVTAKLLKWSGGYLSDVRMGRRKVSDGLVEKLRRLAQAGTAQDGGHA